MKKTPLFLLVTILCFSCALWEGEKNSPGGTALTIMTYNIHVGKGMDGITSLERIYQDIENAGADIVGLQELDRFTKRNPVDQAAELEKISGFHAVFSKNIAYQGGEYGVAILSRFPVLEKRVLHYKQMEGLEFRGALAVKVNPDSTRSSKPLWFVTTHLGTDATGEEQKEQVIELLDWLNEFAGDARLIVSGDMNAMPEDAAIRLFETDFVDLWNEAGKEDGFTFNALEPSRRIDYLFVRGKDFLSCDKAYVPNTAASDHRPVVAHIVLK